MPLEISGRAEIHQLAGEVTARAGQVAGQTRYAGSIRRPEPRIDAIERRDACPHSHRRPHWIACLPFDDVFEAPGSTLQERSPPLVSAGRECTAFSCGNISNAFYAIKDIWVDTHFIEPSWESEEHVGGMSNFWSASRDHRTTSCVDASPSQLYFGVVYFNPHSTRKVRGITSYRHEEHRILWHLLATYSIRFLQRTGWNKPPCRTE
jgi:hypothetical protein